MEEQLEVPLPPGSALQALSREELRDELWKSYGGPPISKPWQGAVGELYSGWHTLGRDMGGTTYHAERESWLQGWAGDEGEKEAGHLLFRVLEGAMREIRQEEREREEKKGKRGRGGR